MQRYILDVSNGLSITFAAMKKYLRVLKFAKPYIPNAVANGVFNLLMVLFSFASIGTALPLLEMLFNNTKRITELPEDFSITSNGKDWVYYQFGLLIDKYGELELLGYVAMTGALMFLLKNLFRYLALWSLAPLRNGVIHDMRQAIHKKCLELPISYFSEKRKGDILTRMSSDITELQWSFLTSLEMVVRDPLMILGTVFLLFMLSTKLTIFVVIVFPITGFLISLIGKFLKRASGRAQAQLGFLLSIFEETLSGLRIIKAFRAEKTQEDRFIHASGEYTKSMNATLRTRDLSSPVNEFIGASVIFLIMWYGGVIILGNPEESNSIGLTGAQLMLYVALFYQIIPAFRSLTGAINNIQKGTASAERILEILDAENPIVERPNAVELPEFKNVLSLNNVSFKYDLDGPTVLNKVSFDLHKGKTIALVGASGSGKTTISNLIPRFWDVTEGSITIDGVDIRDSKIGSLRGLMGIVNQESILFNDSIRNNIALGKPDASDEEIRKAAEVANAAEFIDKMEEGYATNIGEGGGKLSGGQRQRMSIARAVLEDPPILILDEATSALDTESERIVQDALNKLMSNRTSLIIAHRLSTIQHADEILVMQEGQIVERGTHDELLQKNGAYANLVNMQSFG